MFTLDGLREPLPYIGRVQGEKLSNEESDKNLTEALRIMDEDLEDDTAKNFVAQLSTDYQIDLYDRLKRMGIYEGRLTWKGLFKRYVDWNITDYYVMRE